MLGFQEGGKEEHAGASPLKPWQNSLTSDSGLYFVFAPPGHWESQAVYRCLNLFCCVDYEVESVWRYLPPPPKTHSSFDL